MIVERGEKMDDGVIGSLSERYINCSINLKIMTSYNKKEERAKEVYQKISESYLHELCFVISKHLEKLPLNLHWLNNTENIFLYIEKSVSCCLTENQKQLFFEEFFTSVDML